MPASSGGDVSPAKQMNWACMNNDVAKVRRLVAEHGPGILKIGDGRDRPIHFAASEGATEIVAMILAAGEEVDVAGSSGTALHFAARMSRLPVVQMLIERGADVNALHDRVTPVMKAVNESWCDPAVVLHLIEKGADISWRIRDIEGHDFLRLVLKRDNAPVFGALAKAGLLEKAKGEPALEYALGKAQMAQVVIPRIVEGCLADPEQTASMTDEYLRQLAVYESSSSVRSLLLSKATELALLSSVDVAPDDKCQRRAAGGPAL
jgi:hypothetical protein